MASGTHNLIALPPGHLLGEYRIERYLGSGGFGITYSAIDENLDCRVAIKEYLPKSLAIRDANNRVNVGKAEDETDFRWGLGRFLDEARALAQFDHPNIVGVKRFIEAHGTGYIVMEYVEGEPLCEILKRKPTLTEPEIREHVLPLTAGLAEVHAAGLLHRDIKPSNIMVRDDGVPVLIDFGSARLAVNAKSQSLTAVVTPGYAPLEQYAVKGRQLPPTDIYALGAVLYRCVTGITPRDATERALEDRLAPVAETADGVYSNSLLTAIDAALAMRVDDRPSDIAVFLNLVSTGDNGRTVSEFVDRDIEVGNNSLVQAAECGDAEAQYRLGRRYSRGENILSYVVKRRDLDGEEAVQEYFAQAVQWYRRAAEQGHVKSQYHLGSAYEWGLGVSKDGAQAVQWYRRAAEQGDVEAQYHLGTMYDTGKGELEIGAQEAAQWCTRAAEQGLAEAQHLLCQIYANGEGVQADNIQAYAWANLASVGLEDAVNLRDEIAANLTGAQLADAKQFSRELEARIQNSR